MPLPPPKPPLSFTAPSPKEKISKERIFAWTCVAAGIGLILLMILTNKPEKKLVCNSAQQASLTSFGTCGEE